MENNSSEKLLWIIFTVVFLIAFWKYRDLFRGFLDPLLDNKLGLGEKINLAILVIYFGGLFFAVVYIICAAVVGIILLLGSIFFDFNLFDTGLKMTGNP